jgi:uncharacterized membrane protein|tara:strand:- start:1023 stop:1394 length:372 start_codon:yes stop_codon:yes gene_type:complete
MEGAMSEFVKPAAEWIAAIIELLGVSIILVLAVYALTSAIYQLTRKKNEIEFIYRQTRQRLGRGILLGLEFLVAADIIHTVAVELTFKTVGVLAIIVVIRTFLSFTLEVELTGKWPWQENGNK